MRRVFQSACSKVKADNVVFSANVPLFFQFINFYLHGGLYLWYNKNKSGWAFPGQFFVVLPLERSGYYMRYRPGDMIVYGNSGVCQVIDIGTPDGVDPKKRYYILRPLYSQETIYTPVETTVFMRPVISRAEAEALIAQIPSIRGEVYQNRNLSLLTAHYQESIQTHDCGDLVQLIRDIYAKSRWAVQSGRKLGLVDQRYWKKAEVLLHSELAVALGIPPDEVPQYIENAIGPMESGAPA